jgi:uncharacterized protein (TIGR03084 family)
MLSEAPDFAEETRVLAALLRQMSTAQWTQATQFKQWTPEQILRHLHAWNEAADWAVHAPQAFEARLAGSREQAKLGQSMRDVEYQMVPLGGAALLDLWESFALDMAARWQALDGKLRVAWAGPPMSVRSSITARQMEAWAHGQAIFDMLGQDRPESARLRNIVVLGVNTFAWTHRVRDWAIPAYLPRIELTAPLGEKWSFGEEGESGSVQGSARDFAQVVTQTRHLLDTELRVEGEVARRWMLHAQCFAGAAEDPPTPGLRHTRVRGADQG